MNPTNIFYNQNNENLKPHGNWIIVSFMVDESELRRYTMTHARPSALGLKVSENGNDDNTKVRYDM